MTQLAIAADLACAARADGAVVCWGSDASGALTRAESERSPRLVTLRR